MRTCLRMACAAMAALLGGCSGGASAPPVHTVTGTVTWNDEIVPGATVKMVVEGTSWAATATTNEQGVYEIQAFEGKNRVAISKLAGGSSSEEVDVTAAIENEGDTTPTDRPPDDRDDDEYELAIEHLLPTIYANPSYSGLTADVGEQVTFDFELTGSLEDDYGEE